MRAHSVVLLTILVLSLHTEGNGVTAKMLGINKCCGMFQMLSGDGQSCVDAPWPRNHGPRLGRFWSDKVGVRLRHRDAAWVRHWMPPGLPLHRVRQVYLNERTRFRYKPVVQTVLDSVLREELQEIADGAAYWRKDRVYFSQIYEGVARAINNPWPPTHFGKAVHSFFYCVDAARPPLAPFALLSEVNCAYEDCFVKCCHPGEVMAAKEGGWMCEDDPRGFWTPHNSSFASLVPTDVPYRGGRMSYSCLPPSSPSPRPRPLARGNAWEKDLLRHRFHDFFFASWETCVDVQLRQDGTLGESVFYCKESLITRGVYRMLQPLSFVSSALTMVAVVAVACNRSMRVKAHGWCLACHAVCLLGFNLGQVAYYLSISDGVLSLRTGQPYYLINKCLYLAFPMYFLLTAANCWLTALCVNMALGFRKLRVARSGAGKDWKRFLVLSVLAWAAPAIMTGICAHTHNWDPSLKKWFSPTLVETRTCFDEVAANEKSTKLLKSGTALFYYAPMGLLSAVNFVCIGRTLKKVHFLRRGNSVLRRDEYQLHRQTEGQGMRATAFQKSDAVRSSVADAKAIKTYVKMIVMTGGVEILVETIFWLTSSSISSISMIEFFYNSTFAYRVTGYIADCSRAACVAWLAAPEEGYIHALRRLWRGSKRGRSGGSAQ